jgi:MFS transporter, SP family, major inositol transporter
MSVDLRTARASTVQATREDPRTFLFRPTFIASMGGLLLGFDTGVIAGASVYLREDFGLTAVTEGPLVTSLPFPGAAAGALLWLCSDLAAFATGHALVMDGGQTVGI